MRGRAMKQRAMILAAAILGMPWLARAAPNGGPSAAQAAEEAAAGAGARNTIAAGGNDSGYDMAPETRLSVVEAAVAAIPTPLPPGPVRPTWDSLKAHYRVPDWYAAAKFGLFMHWGLYDVPAHGSEWYEKHMYGPFAKWHTEHFGPIDQFGYKDFIPKFTAAKFDPDAWAELFKRSGAKFVIPTAQHHDGFALWASDGAAPWNAGVMGPKRDLIGDLCKAVRARGLKFGVSNHGIENFQFVNPSKEVAALLQAAHADVYDPKYQDFYHVMDRSDAACEKFLVNWAARNVELIDKYQPDVLWFDNGIDQRYLDPLKLWLAAYYYDRAATWGKQVTLNTKKAAYAPAGTNTQTIGSVIDFEKIGGRSPSGIRTGTWDVDEPIGSTWGYTTGERISTAANVVQKLVDTASKNGTLLLNLSPEADGTLNQAQQDTLLGVGKWLETNGEAIYGTHNWVRFGEGGGRGSRTPTVRFTVKGDDLYAIVVGAWPAGPVTVASLGTAAGHVAGVTLLGAGGPLKFAQDSAGLTVTFPPTPPCKFAYALKVTGLKTNPTTVTADGNPMP
jgi:alpha-L-fucosidase